MKHYHFSKSDTAIAKLIAILLMMLHHLFGFTDRIAPENMYHSLHIYQGQPLEAVICASFKVCVAFFLFLSGYGTYLSIRKSKNISQTIATRIYRLLKNVWQVMLIFVPIDFALGVTKVNLTASWTIHYDFESIILSMLGFEKYNSEWWFVMPYIVLLMMTPLLFRFLKRKNGDFFTDFLVVLGGALFSLYGIQKLLNYDMFADFKGTVWGILLSNVVYLLPVYLFGMIFAKYQVFSYYHQILPRGIWRYPVLIFIAVACFFMRYRVGSAYDFFLVGPMIYACVMCAKKIPGVTWISGKVAKYITLVWLTHSFYVFQFGQKFIYSFKNPILIFMVLIGVSFATAIAIYWLFVGLSKGINKIRCSRNQR